MRCCMKILRCLSLFFLTFFYLIISNANAKNIENFSWTFENDFVDVYSIIDHDQPEKCQLSINEFAVEKKNRPLWNDAILKKPDIYHFVNDQEPFSP